jgi:hypothetical protein
LQIFDENASHLLPDLMMDMLMDMLSRLFAESTFPPDTRLHMPEAVIASSSVVSQSRMDCQHWSPWRTPVARPIRLM